MVPGKRFLWSGRENINQFKTQFPDAVDKEPCYPYGFLASGDMDGNPFAISDITRQKRRVERHHKMLLPGRQETKASAHFFRN
jgi:hypothetical protein